MVKYIFPKLKNRWGIEELTKQRLADPKNTTGTSTPAPCGEITEQELMVSRTSIQGLLDDLERTLDTGPWVVGQQFTLADIAIAPYMFRVAALEADKFWSHNRRVNEWYSKLAAHPAFRTVVSWPDESGGGYEEVGLEPGLPN
jgi:glutathione S-transferase